MTGEKVCTYFRLSAFFSIFCPLLIESTDVEYIRVEGRLYLLLNKLRKICEI
jgi:hypothetical protein